MKALLDALIKTQPTFTFHEFVATHENNLLGERLKAAAFLAETSGGLVVATWCSNVDIMALSLGTFLQNLKDNPDLAAGAVKSLNTALEIAQGLAAQGKAA